MNKILENFARRWIKENIIKFNRRQIILFKRMYSHLDINKDIDDVVRDMPTNKLDVAMRQMIKTAADSECIHLTNKE